MLNYFSPGGGSYIKLSSSLSLLSFDNKALFWYNSCSLQIKIVFKIELFYMLKISYLIRLILVKTYTFWLDKYFPLCKFIILNDLSTYVTCHTVCEGHPVLFSPPLTSSVQSKPFSSYPLRRGGRISCTCNCWIPFPFW